MADAENSCLIAGIAGINKSVNTGCKPNRNARKIAT